MILLKYKNNNLENFFSLQPAINKYNNHCWHSLIYSSPPGYSSAYLYVKTFWKICLQNSHHYNFKPSDDFCLLYSVEGEGILTFENKTISLKSNCLYFWPCKNSYFIEAVSSQWNYNLIFVNGAEIIYYYNQFQPFSQTSIFIPDHSKLFHLIQHFENQIQTFQSPFQHILFLTNFFIELITISQTQMSPLQVPNYLLEIRNQFDHHYDQYYSLDLLAEQFSINKYKIVKEFSHYFGVSPINYLVNCRIEAAKNLLISTNAKIHDIGFQVGYENTTHFINSFKKHTGLTPLNYRKEYSI